MNDWLNMGGYAPYVWGSYLLALAVVAVNLWLPSRCEGQLRRRLRKRAAHKKLRRLCF